MLDQLARFNQKRWEELAQSNVPYSRPMLDLDADSARDFVDPEGILGDVKNKKVLCLAGGGGQQTAAFGLLGAEVVVLDLTLTQLDRDRQAAQHYGLQIQTCQGDMRDLSRFAADHFDIVHHAHSINFIPDPKVVFDQVARIVKNSGYYCFSIVLILLLLSIMYSLHVQNSNSLQKVRSRRPIQLRPISGERSLVNLRTIAKKEESSPLS